MTIGGKCCRVSGSSPPKLVVETLRGVPNFPVIVPLKELGQDVVRPGHGAILMNHLIYGTSPASGNGGYGELWLERSVILKQYRDKELTKPDSMRTSVGAQCG